MRRALNVLPLGLGIVMLQLFVVAGLNAEPASADSTAGCSFEAASLGFCDPDAGGGVTITDQQTEGGPGAESSDPNGGPADPDNSTDGGTPTLTPQEVCEATPGPPSAFCRSLTPVGVASGQPFAPAAQGWSVTVSDLARFVPSTATVVGEPDNIAVVGLPANFVSSAMTETIPGTVLGRGLNIRFTPVGYAFDYGDGGKRTSSTAGAPWGAIGLAQFTPTDTSHVYTQPGTYTVTVTVTYAAEVDLGAGWIPINGTLIGPAASQQVRVVRAHTALVQGTCSERPGSPGC
ncbi:hypothetical protein RL72_02421 [Microbacterium azadirachtae]|uniref:PKD domain-containing protein n=2 Tax=Microbacterium azadirachtae TaxID=582680 RepID=A0A0F0KLW1_9MICO|nr:hypothetical protein RL72_02421 [Microbacterium azadirachtae]